MITSGLRFAGRKKLLTSAFTNSLSNLNHYRCSSKFIFIENKREFNDGPKKKKNSFIKTFLKYSITTGLGFGTGLIFTKSIIESSDFVKNHFEDVHKYILSVLHPNEKSPKAIDLADELKVKKKKDDADRPSLVKTVKVDPVKEAPVSKPSPVIAPAPVPVAPAPPKQPEAPAAATVNKVPVSQTKLPDENDIEAILRKESEHDLTASKVTEESLKQYASHASGAVQMAISDLNAQIRICQDYIRTVRSSDGNLNSTKIIRAAELYEHAKVKSTKNIVTARSSLAITENALDSVKNDIVLKSSPIVKDLLDKISNNHRDLNITMKKADLIDNELNVLLKSLESAGKTFTQIHADLQTITPDVKKANDGTSSKKMSTEEVNQLLTHAYNRLGELESRLRSAEQMERERLDQVLSFQAKVNSDFTDNEVKKALAQQQNQHKLERFEWEKEADQRRADEMHTTLIRHNEHLSAMLKLKEEQMEHDFENRLREAAVVEKKAFEKAVRGWTKRMEAIEKVVDGRADLDRLAKESQSMWLAMEALASAIEFPMGLKSGGRLQQEPAECPPTCTGPLGPLVNNVCATLTDSSEQSQFTESILKRIPKQALSCGVYTAESLKNRFEQVHKMSKRVALMDECNTSLFDYFRSWMLSSMMFESFAQLSESDAYFTQDSEVNEDEPLDPFKLLRSAKKAVAEGDLLFAVRLMNQLQGQSKAVANDWIEDVIMHLETHMLTKTLLAYAAAQGVTTFNERL